jgi:ABC-type multidrug transport system fused ATPase/permease subunit
LIGVFTLVGVALEMLSLGSFIPFLVLLTRESALAEVRSGFAPVAEWPDQQILSAALGLLILLFVVKNALLVGIMWFQRTVLARISTRIADNQYETYLRQPYLFHKSNNTAILIRNMQNSALVVSSGIEPLVTIVSESLVVLGAFVLLSVVEPLVTGVVTALFGAVGLFLHRRMRRRIIDLGSRRNFHLGLTLKEQQQGLNGIKEILLSGRADSFVKLHRHHVREAAFINRTYGAIQAFPRLVLEILTVSGLSALVFLVVAGGRSPTDALPIVGVFGLAVFRIQPSITRLLVSLQAVTYAAPMIAEFGHGSRLVGPRPVEKGEKVVFKGSVSFCDVHFTYPDSSSPVLEGASFEIRALEKIGLAGASGAGKSTVVDLILGLVDPTAGRILIDGRDITEVRRSWQDQIGYVPQHIFLLDDTVRRNVAFGVPDSEISDLRVKDALARAQLAGFIADLEDGLDTRIGERGIRFSGGQQQRLGIARALYHMPPMLVFDEATSSLDSTTERGVAEAIAEAGRSRTVVVVAHRVATLASCDRVLLVEHGKVFDAGPPVQALLDRLVRGPE